MCWCWGWGSWWWWCWCWCSGLRAPGSRAPGLPGSRAPGSGLRAPGSSGAPQQLSGALPQLLSSSQELLRSSQQLLSSSFGALHSVLLEYSSPSNVSACGAIAEAAAAVANTAAGGAQAPSHGAPLHGPAGSSQPPASQSLVNPTFKRPSRNTNARNIDFGPLTQAHMLQLALSAISDADECEEVDWNEVWTPCRTKQARRLLVSQKVRILYRRVPRLRGSRRRRLLLRPRHWLHACPSLR